jgi:hypothetical protein
MALVVEQRETLGPGSAFNAARSSFHKKFKCELRAICLSRSGVINSLFNLIFAAVAVAHKRTSGGGKMLIMDGLLCKYFKS